MPSKGVKREKDWTGEVCGLLFVLREQHHVTKAGRKRFKWLCQCACGNLAVIDTEALKNNRVKSCGYRCRYRAWYLSPTNASHDLYNIWSGLVDRCTNPSAPGYSNYQNRGVYWVWEESFLEFVSYVEAVLGPRPSAKHTIDRINNLWGYFPGNIRWADQQTQSRNRQTSNFYEYGGRWYSVREICDATGLNYNTVKSRLRSTWSVDDIMNTPVLRGKDRFYSDKATPILRESWIKGSHNLEE